MRMPMLLRKFLQIFSLKPGREYALDFFFISKGIVTGTRKLNNGFRYVFLIIILGKNKRIKAKFSKRQRSGKRQFFFKRAKAAEIPKKGIALCADHSPRQWFFIWRALRRRSYRGLPGPFVPGSSGQRVSEEIPFQLPRHRDGRSYCRGSLTCRVLSFLCAMDEEFRPVAGHSSGA